MNRIVSLLLGGSLMMSPCIQVTGAEGLRINQQDEVSFRSELAFADAKSEAKQTGQYIFIDFYATWCAPCKTMDKEVFTDPSVADFMNRAFVNLKIDGEKGQGIDLVKQFGVRAYPTFVILNSDGSEVFRIVGARRAPVFLEELEKGLDDQRSPEMLKKRYDQGERTPALINDYALTVMQSGNEAAGYQLIHDYFHGLSSDLKADPANSFLYERYSRDLHDEKIAYLIANRDDFVREGDRAWVDALMYRMLRLELIPYANGYRARTETYDETAYSHLQTQIAVAGLQGPLTLEYLVEIADARGRSLLPDANFIAVCERLFPKLTERDRFLIMHSFYDYANHPEAQPRQKAIQLINTYMHEVSENTAKAIQKVVAELEYADQQTGGVQFQELSFDAALAAASQQEKLIFLDAFTTWCGPCKMMDRQVFARDEVGEFLNPQFINLKIDMEKGEGPDLAKRYDVRAYPTFLLINSDGELVHRIVGFQESNAFMAAIRKGLHD